MANDPWKHRSESMCCKTCMWAVEKVVNSNDPQGNTWFGRCRKNAPTMSGYPAIFGNDWCGQHKLDETKI